MGGCGYARRKEGKQDAQRSKDVHRSRSADPKKRSRSTASRRSQSSNKKNRSKPSGDGDPYSVPAGHDTKSRARHRLAQTVADARHQVMEDGPGVISLLADKAHAHVNALGRGQLDIKGVLLRCRVEDDDMHTGRRAIEEALRDATLVEDAYAAAEVMLRTLADIEQELQKHQGTGTRDRRMRDLARGRAVLLVFHDSLDILFAGAYAAQVQYEKPAVQAPSPASPNTSSSPTFSPASSPGVERKEQASSGAAGVSQPDGEPVAEEQPSDDGSGSPAVEGLEAAVASAAAHTEDHAESFSDNSTILGGLDGLLPMTPLQYTPVFSPLSCANASGSDVLQQSPFRLNITSMNK